jgi:hypothetical protein
MRISSITERCERLDFAEALGKFRHGLSPKPPLYLSVTLWVFSGSYHHGGVRRAKVLQNTQKKNESGEVGSNRPRRIRNLLLFSVQGVPSPQGKA